MSMWPNVDGTSAHSAFSFFSPSDPRIGLMHWRLTPARRAVIVIGIVFFLAPMVIAQRARRDDQPAAAVSFDEFRVVRSDARAFVVEYRPRYLRVDTLRGANGEEFIL